MRRLLTLLAALALLGSGAALAGSGDPQKKITAADQARARAMLLRKSDLGFGYRAMSSSGELNGDCAALDESDLTVTGEAKTPTFTSGLITAYSTATIYGSVADANASWKQGTSTAGTACVRSIVRREFGKLGLKLLSLRTAVFPKLVSKTVAYRIVFSGKSQGLTVRAYLDFIVLQQSRAQVSLLFGSVIDPLEKSEQVRLARIVAGRTVKAMRGA